MDWDKTDIIQYLSKLRGYRSYLEICTPTTGGQFAKIDQSRFDVCHRLMYRCPRDFSDGLNINFRTPDAALTACVADINRKGLRYDIILVDPWHEYDSSLRDMQAALSLLTDRGSMVIHDCCPQSDDLISPKVAPGLWCGVTFIAYVNFMGQNSGLEYRTVDTDYGCGIVQKNRELAGAAPSAFLHDLWDSARSDPSAAFQFMQQFRYSLLNLISVERFIRTEAEAMLANWSSPLGAASGRFPSD
jgi:hypothetical protein